MYDHLTSPVSSPVTSHLTSLISSFAIDHSFILPFQPQNFPSRPTLHKHLAPVGPISRISGLLTIFLLSFSDLLFLVSILVISFLAYLVF